MSHLCNLSRVYTNHCIRVTGATFLRRQNFSAKQVMSVTGHKSVNTLALYERVNDDEKLLMGMAMNHYLTSTPQDLQPEYAEKPEEISKLPESPAISRHPPLAPKRNSNTIPPPIPLTKKKFQQQPANLLQNKDTNIQPTVQNALVPAVIPNLDTNNPPIIPQVQADFDLFEPLGDDILEIVNSLEKQESEVTSMDGTEKTITMKQTQVTKISPPLGHLPSFSHCKIENLHIHIHPT